MASMIAFGNLAVGFSFVGPFNSHDDAAWRKTHRYFTRRDFEEVKA